MAENPFLDLIFSLFDGNVYLDVCLNPKYIYMQNRKLVPRMRTKGYVIDP